MSTDITAKKRMAPAHKGLAVAAVAALGIAGVGTSALWQDQHTSDPTTIELGSFGLQQTDFRVSINGQPIDPTVDKAAPGDTILLEYDYRATSDAINVIDLTADYVPNIGYAGGGALAEAQSWISTDLTGNSVVNQSFENAPYKVTLVDGQANFTATATMHIPENLDNVWTGSAITYEGTMYVSQGDTVNADPGSYEVATADAKVTARGASTWPGLDEGGDVHLSEQSDGRVQIVQMKPAPDYYVEFFTEATIDSLIAGGYFTPID